MMGLLLRMVKIKVSDVLEYDKHIHIREPLANSSTATLFVDSTELWFHGFFF
jgi:hypothetical protein